MCLFQAALDTPRDSPFTATLSVHGLHFTVYALSRYLNNMFKRIFLMTIQVRREQSHVEHFYGLCSLGKCSSTHKQILGIKILLKFIPNYLF